MTKKGKWLLFGTFLLTLISAAPSPVGAINVNQFLNSDQFSQNISILLTISMISLVPFFLIATTSFIRVAIVLSMVKNAIGTQQIPPSTVIVTLAVFMTVYIMTPVWQAIQKDAYNPYKAGSMSQQTALEKGLVPLKKFMISQTRPKDLMLFVQFSKIPPVKDIFETPMYVVIPSFIISELKTAFQMGFILFIPFVVVDMIVSNVLLSLGMFMLSPVMVSLPFKILLFVLADGWYLICQGLMQSFRY